MMGGEPGESAAGEALAVIVPVSVLLIFVPLFEPGSVAARSDFDERAIRLD
jgi:hypothetical protein